MHPHGIPKRFTRADLRDIDKELFSGVFEYAASLSKQLKAGKGVLLSGNPGIGKSFALAALHNHLHKRVDGMRGRTFDHYFVTAPVLFDRIYQFTPVDVDEHREQGWDKTFETVQVLTINDLGKEDRRGKMFDTAVYQLGRLLRQRNEEQLVTNFTTQLALDPAATTNLKKVYGESVWSLIKGACDIREQIVAEDRR